MTPIVSTPGDHIKNKFELTLYEDDSTKLLAFLAEWFENNFLKITVSMISNCTSP